MERAYLRRSGPPWALRLSHDVALGRSLKQQYESQTTHKVTGLIIF